MSLRTVLANVFVASLLLLIVDLAFHFFSAESFSEREKKLAAMWKWPLDSYHALNGPAVGLNVAHPFWGFSPNLKRRNINNHGFFSDVDYPYKKRPNEKVIGLYGGSVAQRAFPYIAAEIQKSDLSCMSQFTVLNFAIGATKQPSQFNIFHTYIDTVDVSINLDGYNDAVFNPGNHFPAHYPYNSAGLYNLTSEKLEILEKINRARRFQLFIYQMTQDNRWLLYSAIYSRFLFSAKNYLDRRIHSEMERLREIEGGISSSPRRLRELVEIWAKYVRLHHGLSLSREKRSYFFVQPTQYLEGSKILTPWEKKNAISSYRVQFVPGQFELLVESSNQLKREGIKIFDLSRIFGREERQIFADDCCHLNETGNRILAERIVDAVAPDLCD